MDGSSGGDLGIVMAFGARTAPGRRPTIGAQRNARRDRRRRFPRSPRRPRPLSARCSARRSSSSTPRPRADGDARSSARRARRPAWRDVRDSPILSTLVAAMLIGLLVSPRSRSSACSSPRVPAAPSCRCAGLDSETVAAPPPSQAAGFDLPVVSPDY